MAKDPLSSMLKQHFLKNKKDYINIAEDDGLISKAAQRKKVAREIQKRAAKRAQLEAKLKLQLQKGLGKDEEDMRKDCHTKSNKLLHETGFLLGCRASQKLRAHKMLKDLRVGKNPRQYYKDWTEEFQDLDYIVVHKALDPHVLLSLTAELAVRRSRSVSDIPKFKGATGLGWLLFGSAEANESGVNLPDSPILSGFLDGLKETMGWLEKYLLDVTLLESPENTPVGVSPGLNTDMERETMLIDDFDKRWPIGIYFSLDPLKPVYLKYKLWPGERGRPPGIHTLKVPPLSIMFFDPVNFLHCTKERELVEGVPEPVLPMRVKMLLHGLPVQKKEHKTVPKWGNMAGAKRKVYPKLQQGGLTEMFGN